MEKTRARREAAREQRRDTSVTVVIDHLAPDVCDSCGLALDDADELSDEVSEEYEYVPPRIVRPEHRRERKVCTCGCFAIGAAPVRVDEGVCTVWVFMPTWRSRSAATRSRSTGKLGDSSAPASRCRRAHSAISFTEVRCSSRRSRPGSSS